MPEPIDASVNANQGMVTDAQVARELALAFAPLHKRAFGIAVGSAAGLLVFALTAFQLLRRPAEAPNLWLLSHYFSGYAVTWAGAFVGLAWGFVSGFVMGWFVAFARNLVLAVWMLALQTRAELSATRDFLDHI